MAGNPALKSRIKLPRSVQMMVEAGRLTEAEAHRALGGKTRSKYGNVRCEHDGFKFDSRSEMKHYCGLALRQKAREITGLVVHPAYPIMLNGVRICDVEMDFAYEVRATGEHRVEDIKGKDNPLSRLKRRLLEAAYPHIKVEVIPCN